MPAEITRDGIVEEFASEFRQRWHELPNKWFFLGLLAAWMLLFHLVGNSTLSYIKTVSLPGWMLSVYLDDQNQDDLHGVIVPFLVLGLFWWKRKELLAVRPRVWWPALMGIGLALLLHIAGYMVQQPRVSIVAMFAGVYCLIGLVWGPRWMARSFFPFVLFVFCIPLATLSFFNDRITFPLRLLSASIVEFIAHLGLAPDLVRDGTQLAYIGQRHQWQVDIAPACSGIRGLTALLLMTITYGMIVFRAPWKRLVMACAAVPLAVVNNVLRISFSILVGRFFGEEALKAVEQKAGFYTFLGIAIPLVMLTGWLLGDRWRKAPKDQAVTASPPGEPTIPARVSTQRPLLATLSVASVALMAGSVVLLGWLQDHQRLGEPGVRTSPLPDQPPGSIVVKVDLPEWVSVYDSEELDVGEVVRNYLPPDTSYGQRLYTAPDDLQIQVTAVLMGMDRTSIHKPQICLVGGGWTILRQDYASVPIPDPTPYELPVCRIIASRQAEVEGKSIEVRCVYVYWFVDKDQLTASHEDRVLSIAKSMVTEGVLERWAYISCLVQCLPGQEDWAFERIKRFMANGVPKFQIPGGTTALVGGAPGGASD